MKKIILIVSLIVLIFTFTNKNVQFIVLFLFSKIMEKKYEYHHFCNENNCLTVITHYKPEPIGASVSRYVVYGENDERIPLRSNYIKFDSGSNLIVKWESKNLCSIYTVYKPEKVMKINENLIIKIIKVKKRRFNELLQKYPESSIVPKGAIN